MPDIDDLLAELQQVDATEVDELTIESDSILVGNLRVKGTLAIKPGASLDMNGFRLMAGQLVGSLKTVGGRLKIVGVERGGVFTVGGAIIVVGTQEGPMKVEKNLIEIGTKPVPKDSMVVAATPPTRVIVRVVCQKWEESERGWGVRPDGYSLHLTEADLENYIRAHNRALPKEVPDEYDRPSGTPYWCEVEDGVLGDLIRATDAGSYGIRFGSGPYPGDGGPDGWKTVR